MTGSGDKSGSLRRIRGFFCAALLLILVPPALFAQQSSEQANLDSFIQDVQRFAERKKSWRRSGSPLAPYFAVPLETGLSDSERDDLAELEASGDCLRVHNLLAAGFKGLYPALAPALADAKLNATFHVALGTSRLPASTRCQARRSRNEALANMSSVPASPVNLRLSLSTLKDLPETQWPTRQLARAWLALGSLAFCNNDAVSIALVLKAANRPGGLFLTPVEQAALKQRLQKTEQGRPDRQTHDLPSPFWRTACLTYWEDE